jgi:lysophospholipase L1-like esterase
MSKPFAITNISATVGHSKLAMAIGDSITQGGAQLIGGYRLPLFTANPGLVYKGPMWSFGYHAGYSGYRIDQISAAVLPIIDTYAPMIVTLICGTNNLIQGQTAAVTFAAMQTFAAAIKAKASVTNVLVGTIPYLLTAPTEQATYNADIMAWSPPAGIAVYDVSGGVNYPADFSDSLHPNTVGYAKMEAVWNTPIAALL